MMVCCACAGASRRRPDIDGGELLHMWRTRAAGKAAGLLTQLDSDHPTLAVRRGWSSLVLAR